MDSTEDKDHKRASQPMNGGAPFDAGQYSFFDSMGDDGGLEGGLDEGLDGGLEDGVDVPPEEEEVPIEDEVDLGLLESNEPEDLSYAAMFAHTLSLGKDSMQTPQKMKESLQWNSGISADPIVQPPSAGQARAGSMAGYPQMEQASSGHMPYGDHSLPSPSPWRVYTETPGHQHSPAPGAYQSPGLHGLQGLDLAQISQGNSQPDFHQNQGHASLPMHGMQPSMPAMPQLAQQHLGQQPPNFYQAAPLPQPQQPPKIMTMEEVEAQLRRKSQQQQQQRPQGAPMTGTDLGMLGSMGPPMQPGLSVQLSASVPLQPEHMQHGPPGFPSPAGPPHRPPQYDSQHLGTQPPLRNIPGPRPPTGPPPPMPPPDRAHMPMHAHPFPPPPPGVRGPPGPQVPGMPLMPGMSPPGGPAGFPGMPGPPFLGPGMQHMRGHPGPSAWQRPLHHMMGPRPNHMMPPMGHYPPMPPPMPPSSENLKGADLLRHRCMYGSKLMSSDEIENILRIQEKFLTSGVPYNEDYYYLACKHKHRKLHEHALHFFAPEALRDAAPASRPATEDAAYAKLEGLGKIPFSNIRRPRPLMDLMDKQPAEQSEEATPEPDDKGGRRRLEDEPLLAARIVVEECLNVLLDLDDIDRLWVNAPGPRIDKAELQKRRSNLLEVLGRNLRVPRTAQAQKGGAGDGVFMRLMALPKGRGMLTRALRVLYAPPSLYEAVPGALSSEEAPLHISWALLRNIRTLYGCASQVGQKGAQRGGSGEDVALQAADRDIEVTSALAGSAAELLSRLDSTAAVNQSMEALVHGDLHLPADGTYSISDALLPLYIPGEATSARRLWLADIFVALLQRAQELGLSNYSSESRDATSKASSDGQEYHALFNIFYKLVYEHIASLVEVYNMATAAGMTEAADYAKSIAPVNLIRALMPHTSDAQRAELLSSLNQIQ